MTETKETIKKNKTKTENLNQEKIHNRRTNATEWIREAIPDLEKNGPDMMACIRVC